MDTIRAFRRLMLPIISRIRRVCMGAIVRNVDDGGKIQRAQVETLGHSVYDNVEKFGQFGFASNPPPGLDAVIVERNGKYIIVAIGDRKFRIKNLESGDTAIYDMRGQRVLLNSAGITVSDQHGNTITSNVTGIEITDLNENNIKTDSAGININGVLITRDGTMTTPSMVTTGGDITSGGDVISATGNTLDTHKHGVTTAVATSSPAPTGSWPTTPPLPA